MRAAAPLSRRVLAIALGATVLVLLALKAVALAAPPPPPANDGRANAADLGTLPATVTGTTVGATVETNEPSSDCARTGPSVWYRFTVGSTAPKRLAVELNANGDLDAVIDVFIRQRSQNEPVSCDNSDNRGEAALAFSPSPSTTYLVRVAERSNSVSGSFRLQVFPLPPVARPPGTALAPHGASGKLERVLNAAAAYSAQLVAGVPYRVNLVSRIDGCMSLSIFSPGTTSFDEGSAVASLRCQGYRLFTPRQNGTYSFLVNASGGAVGPQQYHLQIARATVAETAPGVFIRNDQKVHATLHGNRIDVLRLYSFDVTNRSNLQLRLTTTGDTPFDLELLTTKGRELACACGGQGDESIDRLTRSGRYFAVVRARDFSSGKFMLLRRSRAVTSTVIRIDGSRYVQVAPGSSVSVQVGVTPSVSGRATIEIDRFDPIAGWQFYSEHTVTISNGSAALPFTPPHVGPWLVHASFLGSRTASPSDSHYARVVSAAPLTQ
jgi:hypothetical protein